MFKKLDSWGALLAEELIRRTQEDTKYPYQALVINALLLQMVPLQAYPRIM
jgi:hypothetical protein